MKMSFLLSLAGGIVLVIAIWLLWLLLVNGGVFVSIDRTVGDIAGSGSTISVVEVLSLRRVMGIALMLAVVQVVLVTALATLAAFLYNLASGLVGGFEVTLAEDRYPPDRAERFCGPAHASGTLPRPTRAYSSDG